MEKFIIRYFFKFPIEMPRFYGITKITILLKEIHTAKTLFSSQFKSSKEY
jgi:hypothetical protein